MTDKNSSLTDNDTCTKDGFVVPAKKTKTIMIRRKKGETISKEQLRNMTQYSTSDSALIQQQSKSNPKRSDTKDNDHDIPSISNSSTQEKLRQRASSPPLLESVVEDDTKSYFTRAPAPYNYTQPSVTTSTSGVNTTGSKTSTSTTTVNEGRRKKQQPATTTSTMQDQQSRSKGAKCTPSTQVQQQPQPLPDVNGSDFMNQFMSSGVLTKLMGPEFKNTIQELNRKATSIPEAEMANMNQKEFTKKIIGSVLNLPPEENNTSSSNGNTLNVANLMNDMLGRAYDIFTDPQYDKEDDDDQKTSSQQQQQQTSGNSVPSDFSVYGNDSTPPEKPATRSGKYSMMENELNKPHQAYKAFNVLIFSILNELSEKLPHKADHYRHLRKMIEDTIEMDPAKPSDIFRKSIEGKEKYLEKYSTENVAFICKNIKNIELLNMLELDDEWHHFTTEDLKSFHEKLIQLYTVAFIFQDIIPVELFQKVEGFTKSVKVPGFNVNVNPGEPLKPTSQVFSVLVDQLLSDKSMIRDIRKTSMGVISSFQNPIPDSEAFESRMRTAQNSI